MTNKQTAAEAGEALLVTIGTKIPLDAVKAIQSYKENMRDIDVGADYVVWVSEPVNLTRLHTAISEDLGVHPRAMAIKRQLMSRTQKAALLVQAMEIAIKRHHQL